MIAYWPIISLAIAMTVTALALAVEHWFPYVAKLARLQAYTVGTLTLWAGFSLWRVMNGDWQTPLGLAAICGAGGFTVILGYKIDGWVKRIRQAGMAEKADDTLKRS